MKTKKLLSVILALAVVLSCTFALSFAPVQAAESNNEYEKMLAATSAANNYGLADTVNEGKILQAWNWSYKNVIANLETVAEQGFTTIQVSPPNEIKMPTKGVHVCELDNSNGWWMFYQPAGFQLNESTDNALGVKAEFVEMCEKAHKIGLKILVDAVINHMGTDDTHTGVYNNDSTDPMDHVNDRAKLFEPEILAAKAFHTPWIDCKYVENLGQQMPQYNSNNKPILDSNGNNVYGGSASYYDITQSITQHCTSGLPDLDTSKTVVQKAIYDYLAELVEAGADGFRIDAAKHIETSEDMQAFRSNFWENTLLKIRKDYPDCEVYAYGEILNKCGDGRPFSMYTKMMDVTDSSSYWGIKDAVCRNGNGGNSIPYYPNSNFTKENVIQWNESHDTYIDGGTSSLTTIQRDKIWALTAARQTITGVYFARPDDKVGADRGAIEKICSTILIGEANKTSWADPAVKAVNQFSNYFGEVGEYNSVQNKMTLIERGSLGAVIVNLGGTTATANLTTHTLADGTYTDSITGKTFTVKNSKLTGSIGNTGIACLYYSDDSKPVIPDPSLVTNLEDVDVSSGLYPTQTGYQTIVFSDAANWSSVYIYVWNYASDTPAVAWPGAAMKYALTNDYGQKQYVAYIPVEYDRFIINNGTEQTVDLEITGNLGLYMDKKDATGKFTMGSWNPDFFELVVTKPTDPPKTTTPIITDPIITDPTVTDPIITEPNHTDNTKPSDPVIVGRLLGDADENGIVNVKDATTIQKRVAGLSTSTWNYEAADADRSGVVDVKDATIIQKWVAGMTIKTSVGEPF